tara:strand:- start:1369 stop:3312 length:1944 start_codon:yes stop_codon:yes gene_type:complete
MPNKYKSFFLIFSLYFTIPSLFSQILKPISWEFKSDSSSFEIDSTINLNFKAYIDKGWYLYSTDMDSSRPMVTKFYFNKDHNISLLGEIIPVDRKEKYDSTWQAEVTYYNDSALFIQKILSPKTPSTFEGYISYQVCSDIDGMCVPFETEFVFFENLKNTPKKITNKLDTDLFKYDSSIFPFMLFSFFAGLLAILTPCVFPMIPITVSFFINKKESSLKNGLFYGLSIILIFTFIGIILSILLGPGVATDLLSNWFLNLIFFILFIVFGFSLLGFFEITLPSRFVNSIDKKSDKGGLVGVFFMALTLVLVSFSCIGPLVGGILVQSANGFALKPVLGMLSFSIAFAMPFTLLAIFPEQINKLPKSGEWMIIIKTIIGFFIIAYAFKFLNVIDKAYHLDIMDRDIFLFIWIVIFSSMAFYLLNVLKSSINVISKYFAVTISLIIPIYLATGLFGNRLVNLSAYLPPQKSTYINIYSLERVPFYKSDTLDIYGNIKYSELFKFPYDLKGFFDYEESILFAKKVNKPILLDFTGHGCVNCRDIESRVWSDESIRNILNNDYVLVSLYVDDKILLPEKDWYISSYDNKTKKTIGKQNADFQITRFNNNAQPFYVALNPYTEEVIGKPFGYDLNIKNNIDFLKNNLSIYYEN